MNAAVTTLLQYLEGRGVRTVALLTDTNVAAQYPHYWDALEEHFSLLRIVVPAGESSKSLDLAYIFMLNFGGGTVCDLGGFVAATYKRGVPFANCPTTLLAMIDAAIGGKNGIDMLSVKNCIGTIRQPDVVLPDDISFLQTLPDALQVIVNGILAERLSMRHCRILKPFETDNNLGAGMVGELEAPMAADRFLAEVKELLGLPVLRCSYATATPTISRRRSFERGSSPTESSESALQYS